MDHKRTCRHNKSTVQSSNDYHNPDDLGTSEKYSNKHDGREKKGCGKENCKKDEKN